MEKKQIIKVVASVFIIGVTGTLIWKYGIPWAKKKWFTESEKVNDALDDAKDKIEAVIMKMSGVNGIGTKTDDKGSKYIEISVIDEHQVGEVTKYLKKSHQDTLPIKIIVEKMPITQKQCITTPCN